MKYRNNVTNIGIFCGFATNEDGKLRVQQTACKEMGLVFDLAAGVRPAEFPYEPVVVIYQVLPSEGDPTKGDPAPQMIAYHVTRMPKSYVPKTFTWNARTWPLNTPFYPFRPEKAGRLTDQILDSLADSLDMPQWLTDAAERDSELALLLSGPSSTKSLMNRLLVTGKMSTLRMEKHSSGYFHDYAIAELRQPGDEQTMKVTVFAKKPGSSTFAKNDFRNGGMAATAILKPHIRVLDHDEKSAQGVRFDLEAIDLLTVEHSDFMPGANASALRRALGEP